MADIPLIKKEDVVETGRNKKYKKYDRNDKSERPEGDDKLINNEVIDGKYTTITIKTDTFERILRRKEYPGESLDQILNKVFDVMTNRKCISVITKKNKKYIKIEKEKEERKKKKNRKENDKIEGDVINEEMYASRI